VLKSLLFGRLEDTLISVINILVISDIKDRLGCTAAGLPTRSSGYVVRAHADPRRAPHDDVAASSGLRAWPPGDAPVDAARPRRR
jgi:hypothetical protein